MDSWYRVHSLSDCNSCENLTHARLRTLPSPLRPVSNAEVSLWLMAGAGLVFLVNKRVVAFLATAVAFALLPAIGSTLAR